MMIIVDFIPFIVIVSYSCVLFFVFALYHLKTNNERKLIKKYDSPPAKLNFSCSTPVSGWISRPNFQLSSIRTTCPMGPANEHGALRTVKRRLFQFKKKIVEKPLEKIEEVVEVEESIEAKVNRQIQKQIHRQKRFRF
ncbi:uncharacterized protein LOC106672954 [Cimex lectularius]|uniref:Transmembrane protein n=1 Tax=Cimex lectularius TaxID=79782 RepID=A0A8I6TKM9_CIMLE|nr:uncharacterized protein LOC106672954 [Cimex lectularius]